MTVVLVLVLVLVPLVLIARGTWALVRFARLTHQGKRHHIIMIWHRARWRWLCRASGLSWIDQHRPSVFHIGNFRGTRKRIRNTSKSDTAWLRYPRGKWRADHHGWTVTVKEVPKVGRKELEEAIPSLRGAWQVQRIGVSQPRPGRLQIRALRQDPLLTRFGIGDVPPDTYSGADLTQLYVGRDEHGTHRYLTVKDNTAATVAGQPGTGKSVAVNGLLMQWAPSPAVQFGTADGKSPVDGGDYEVWRPRAWHTCNDSREDVADMLSDACAIMRERLGIVTEMTGSRNGWHQGPTVEFPLFGIVLDECQRYLDATVAKRDKALETLILDIQTMAGDIVRQGRSVLMFLILATQKATTDSMPSQIRDNAALSLALAQKTTDASVAALGSSIRDYPSYLPTTLQGPEFKGCAVASMRTGEDPFTRLRFPEVTYSDMAATVRRTSHLLRDPRVSSPLVGV
jgi:hypothetical protein